MKNDMYQARRRHYGRDDGQAMAILFAIIVGAGLALLLMALTAPRG